MFFNKIIREDATDDSLIDKVLPKDPESAEGLDMIADHIEDAMQTQALESVTYFNGGEKALDSYLESAEYKGIIEAFPSPASLKKQSFFNLSKKDDLKRRAGLGSILIAKEKHDPLFNELAKNRIKERKLRKMIFKKYGALALKAARVSQKKHLVEVKKGVLPEVKPAADTTK